MNKSKKKKRKSGIVSFRPSKRNKTLLDRLDVLAEKANRPMNNYIETVLMEHVEIQEQKQLSEIAPVTTESSSTFEALINRLQAASLINHPDRPWTTRFKDDVMMQWSGKEAMLLQRVLEVEAKANEKQNKK